MGFVLSILFSDAMTLYLTPLNAVEDFLPTVHFQRGGHWQVFFSSCWGMTFCSLMKKHENFNKLFKCLHKSIH
jgi:hypothetical protein